MMDHHDNGSPYDQDEVANVSLPLTHDQPMTVSLDRHSSLTSCTNISLVLDLFCFYGPIYSR